MKKSNDPRDHSTRRPDLEALVTFLRNEDGGRRSPTSSGYSAQLDVEGRKRIPALFTFEEEQLVYPGDSLTASLTLLAEAPQSLFYVGLSFRFFENEKFVGTGVVTALL